MTGIKDYGYFIDEKYEKILKRQYINKRQYNA